MNIHDKILSEVKRLKNNKIAYERAQPVDVDEKKIKLVIFMLLDDYYALRADYIKEILICPKITYVPLESDFILGVISVRGDIESVLDLHILLGIPSTEISATSRLVIAEINGIRSAILLDRLIDVIDVSQSTILPPIACPTRFPFTECGLEFKDKFTIVLDLDKIFKKITP